MRKGEALMNLKVINCQGELVVGHGNAVVALTFSPDGKTLASGSYDRTVILWDVRTSRVKQVLPHRDEVHSVAFSPDGKILATATWREVLLWDAKNNECFRCLKGSHCVAFSPDGKILATVGDEPETVRIWDVDRGKLLQTLRGHRYVKCLAFSTNGELLAAGDDETIRLWHVPTSKVLWTLRDCSAETVTFSPDGTKLALGTTPIMVWDIRNKSLRWCAYACFSHGFILNAAFSPNGTKLVSGDIDGTVWIWDAETGQLLQTLIGHSALVRSIAFSPDGKWLASAGDDKIIRLWDTRTWKCKKRLGGWFGEVRAIAPLPNNFTVAAGYNDGSVRFWDVQKGILLRTLQLHQGSLDYLEISPDGQWLASIGEDNALKVFHIRTNKVAWQQVEEFKVSGFTFSPDSKVLAAAYSCFG